MSKIGLKPLRLKKKLPVASTRGTLATAAPARPKPHRQAQQAGKHVISLTCLYTLVNKLTAGFKNQEGRENGRKAELYWPRKGT